MQRMSTKVLIGAALVLAAGCSATAERRVVDSTGSDTSTASSTSSGSGSSSASDTGPTCGIVASGDTATEQCDDGTGSACAVATYCGETATVYDAAAGCAASYVTTRVTCESGRVYSWPTNIPGAL